MDMAYLPWPGYNPYSYPPASPSKLPQFAADINRQPAEQLLKKEVATDKDVKVLRRKQANRESARRSKLRKKAEADGLTQRATTVKVEHEELHSALVAAKQRLRSVQDANLALQRELRQLAGLQEAQEQPQTLAGKLESGKPGS